MYVSIYVCNSCKLQDFMPDQTFDENAKKENDPLQMEQSDQSSQLPQDRCLPDGNLGKQ